MICGSPPSLLKLTTSVHQKKSKFQSNTCVLSAGFLKCVKSYFEKYCRYYLINMQLSTFTAQIDSNLKMSSFKLKKFLSDYENLYQSNCFSRNKFENDELKSKKSDKKVFINQNNRISIKLREALIKRNIFEFSQDEKGI